MASTSNISCGMCFVWHVHACFDSRSSISYAQWVRCNTPAICTRRPRHRSRNPSPLGSGQTHDVGGRDSEARAAAARQAVVVGVGERRLAGGRRERVRHPGEHLVQRPRRAVHARHAPEALPDERARGGRGHIRGREEGCVSVARAVSAVRRACVWWKGTVSDALAAWHTPQGLASGRGRRRTRRTHADRPPPLPPARRCAAPRATRAAAGWCRCFGRSLALPCNGARRTRARPAPRLASLTWQQSVVSWQQSKSGGMRAVAVVITSCAAGMATTATGACDRWGCERARGGKGHAGSAAERWRASRAAGARGTYGIHRDVHRPRRRSGARARVACGGGAAPR